MSAEAAPNLDATLRALADGSRRTILSVVRDRPHSVGEVAETASMSQQIVSHHLRALRDAGLVTEERRGTRHLFMVRTAGLEVVEDYLADFWPHHLAALKTAAEKAAREKTAHEESARENANG